METGFSFTKDGLTRVSGNGTGDKAFAEKSVRELLEFVRKRRENVEQYTTYKHIITKSDLSILSDDLTAMNYIHSELKALVNFFKLNSKFAELFETPRKDVESMLNVSMVDFEKLKSYVIE